MQAGSWPGFYLSVYLSIYLSIYLIYLFFEAGSQYVAQASLEIGILP
jgi:hypothetical protein